MVTIEQKLSLFSKLLQQDVKNDVVEKIEQLEHEYNEKLKENKELVDKQAKEYMEKSFKKAESKKLEIISKSNMESKKYSMAAKEKQITVFMEKLQMKIVAFTKTEAYKPYLTAKLEECKALEHKEENYSVYVTARDQEAYGDYIIEKLVQAGLRKENLTLLVKGDEMLGGIILEIPSESIRVDLSMQNIILEEKESIVEQIFEAIGEVGGTNE